MKMIKGGIVGSGSECLVVLFAVLSGALWFLFSLLCLHLVGADSGFHADSRLLGFKYVDQFADSIEELYGARHPVESERSRCIHFHVKGIYFLSARFAH